jgi:hypothetical protein
MRLLAILTILTFFLIGCSAEQSSSEAEQDISSLEVRVRLLETRVAALEKDAGAGDLSQVIQCLQRQIQCEINGLKLIKSGWDGGYSLQSQGICSGCSYP